MSTVLLKPMPKRLFRSVEAIFDPGRDTEGKNVLSNATFNIGNGWSNLYTCSAISARKNVLAVGADGFKTGWNPASSATVAVYKRNILPANADLFTTAGGWAAYDGSTVSVYRRNMLPAGAENFKTGWSAQNGALVVVTDYPTTIPGIGEVVAKRIQTSGGTLATQFQSSAVATGISGKVYPMGLLIRNLSDKAVKVYSNASGANQVYNQSEEWSQCELRGTAGSSQVQMKIMCPVAGDSLDFLVYQPMITCASALGDYVPPGTGYPDPEGGNNAVRIITVGGNSIVKYFCSTGLTTLIGPAYSYGVQAKSINGVGVRFGDWFGASSGYTDADWHALKRENATYASGGGLQSVFYAYNVSDNLDFLAYHPMNNVGATVDTYVPPQTGYTDPDGGTGAVRIVTVGGTSATVYATIAAATASFPYYSQISCCNLTANTVRWIDSAGTAYADWTQAEGWQRKVFTTASSVGSPLLRLSTLTTGTSVDFLAYHPMVSVTTTPETYVAPQVGYPDPEGGNEAYKIYSLPNTGTSRIKFGHPIAVVTDEKYAYGVQVKVIENECGLFEGATGSGTSEFATADGAWHDLKYVSTSTTTSSSFQAVRMGVQNSASEALHILAFKPRCFYGDKVYPYSPPVGVLQTVTDYSPKGRHLRLGANTSAGGDSADATRCASGLYFGGDDYAVGTTPYWLKGTAGHMFVIFKTTNVAADWQIIMEHGAFGYSGSAVLGLTINSASKVHGFAGYNGATYAQAAVTDKVVTDGAWHIGEVCSDYGTITTGVDDKYTASGNQGIGTANSPNGVMCLGKSMNNVRSYTGMFAYGIYFSRKLSPSERKQAIRYLKSWAAAKGMTLAA